MFTATEEFNELSFLRYTETVTTLDIDENMTSVICIHMINFTGPVTYVHVYIICVCVCVCVVSSVTYMYIGKTYISTYVAIYSV